MSGADITNGSSDPAGSPLVALQAQLIEIDGGALVVRGCTEVKVLGDGAVDAVKRVLTLAGSPIRMEELCEQFAEPDRPAIRDLAQRLADRHILVDPASAEGHAGVEGAETIFFWHFGLSPTEVAERVARPAVTVVGVNAVSARMVSTLAASGITATLVDFGLLRNQRLFGSGPTPAADHLPQGSDPVAYRTWLEEHDPASIDILVATSDHTSTSVMEDWNRTCVTQGITFLPVMLRRMIGYVGPLVVPGETACFACSVARENSHINDHELLRASESVGPHGQAVSGFHSSMPAVLGEVAAFEITRHVTGFMPSVAGSRIEVNLLEPSLASRPVLRAPRCPVCSPRLTRPHASLDRADFVPGAQFQEDGEGVGAAGQAVGVPSGAPVGPEVADG